MYAIRSYYVHLSAHAAAFVEHDHIGGEGRFLRRKHEILVSLNFSSQGDMRREFAAIFGKAAFPERGFERFIEAIQLVAVARDVDKARVRTIGS